ncbi:hypothetical protein LZ30DRAFT_806039 [Colletotrichum cereale]|nr:hypothetical protein LZ30DRAFT_806039 [Colletotrichum cereale]
MPPFLRSKTGSEAPHVNHESNEMFKGPIQPLQAQRTTGGREENKTDLAVDMNDSEAQFSQDHRHHRDLPSELHRNEYQKIDAIMDTAAFSTTAETQVGLPAVIGASSQDQMDWVQDATHVMSQDNEIRGLQDQVIQLKLQLEEYENENTRLRAQVLQLEMQLEDYEYEEDRLKADITHVEKRAEAAEKRQVDEHESHQRNIAEGQAHIHKLDCQIRGLKAQVASRQAVKLQDKAIANSRKVSDDAIKASWKTMAYNIHSLVATILNGSPSGNELDFHGHGDKKESCAFCQLGAHQILLLRQDDDMRASVAEKIVWDAVTQRIFSRDITRCGKSWARAPGQLLSALFNKLLDAHDKSNDPTMLFRWKAESAAMIDDVVGVDNKELENDVYEEYLGLRTFIPHDCPNMTAARDGLRQELRKVFKEAVEIQRIFMQSRAHFYLDRVGETEGVVHYDPEYHEAEAWDKKLSERSIVLLGISPSLVKVGNADGGNYNKSTRLIKASVICD